MKPLEELVKKYFILLIILLPLRKMGVFFIMYFGQEMMLNYFGSFEEYNQGYENLLGIIELFNIYLINIIISLIIIIDLKPNRKLIGIPILTALMPIFGITLFFLQKYYSLNYLKLKNELTD